jgi:hypothetical protein
MHPIKTLLVITVTAALFASCSSNEQTTTNGTTGKCRYLISDKPPGLTPNSICTTNCVRKEDGKECQKYGRPNALRPAFVVTPDGTEHAVMVNTIASCHAGSGCGKRNTAKSVNKVPVFRL